MSLINDFHTFISQMGIEIDNIREIITLVFHLISFDTLINEFPVFVNCTWEMGLLSVFCPREFQTILDS